MFLSFLCVLFVRALFLLVCACVQGKLQDRKKEMAVLQERAESAQSSAAASGDEMAQELQELRAERTKLHETIRELQEKAAKASGQKLKASERKARISELEAEHKDLEVVLFLFPFALLAALLDGGAHKPSSPTLRAETRP